MRVKTELKLYVRKSETHQRKGILQWVVSMGRIHDPD